MAFPVGGYLTVAEAQADGVVFYYNLDENVDGSNIIDKAGNGFGLTTTGTFDQTYPGKFGYALELNGYDTSYSRYTGTSSGADSAYSFSFWIRKVGSFLEVAQLIEINDAKNTILVNAADGVYSRTLDIKIGSEWISISLSQEHHWYHVVIVSDDGAGQCKVYRDGVASIDVEPSNQEGVDDFDDITIGDNISSADRPVILDDLCFWNRALSLQDIANLYNSGEGSVAIAINKVIGVPSTNLAVTGQQPSATITPYRYHRYVLDSVPEVYWRLDEPSGTVAEDETSNDYDGAYVGTPTYSETSVLLNEPSTAVAFDGLTDGAWRVIPAEIKVQTVTIECWVNIPSGAVAGTAYYAACTPSGALGANKKGMLLGVVDGLPTVFLGDNTATWATAEALSGDIRDDIWHHLVATYDATTIRLYVDGVEVDFNTWSGIIYWEDTGGTGPTVGQFSVCGVHDDTAGTGLNLFYEATADEVAIYASTLSAATILEHYDAAYDTTVDLNLPPLLPITGNPPSTVFTVTPTYHEYLTVGEAIAAGVVHYWPMDNLEIVIPDKVGSVNLPSLDSDFQPLYDPDGRIAACRSHAAHGNSGTFYGGTGSGASDTWSISCWINVSEVWDQTFCWVTDFVHGAQMGLDTDNVVLAGTGDGVITAPESTALSLDIWYLITLTSDATGFTQLFINDERVGSLPTGSSLEITDFDYLIIGYLTSAFFKIDELVIWDKVLDFADVAGIYNGGAGLALIPPQDHTINVPSYPLPLPASIAPNAVITTPTEEYVDTPVYPLLIVEPAIFAISFGVETSTLPSHELGIAEQDPYTIITYSVSATIEQNITYHLTLGVQDEVLVTPQDTYTIIPYTLEVGIRIDIVLRAGMEIEITDLIYFRYANVEISIHDILLPIEAGIEIDIVHNVYQLTAVVEIHVTGLYTVSTIVEQNIYGPILGVWTPKVLIDDVDYSAVLVDQMVIRKEEDASTIAEFVISAEYGNIDLVSWVNKEVKIYYSEAGWTILRFRGWISIPQYDPHLGTLTFNCTNSLQGAFRESDRDKVLSIIDGVWSEYIFDDTQDIWQYAQDMLSTVPKALWRDENMAVLATPWAVKSTPDFTYEDSDFIDETVSVEYASRRDLYNKILITIDYKFPMLRQRRMRFHLKYTGKFCDFLWNGFKWPGREQVLNAAKGTSWSVLSMNYTDLPPPKVYQCYSQNPGDVGMYPIVWGMKPDQDAVPDSPGEDASPANPTGGPSVSTMEYIDTHCMGASFTMEKKWVQSITESYLVEVIAPNSISKIGEVIMEESYSVESDYDSESWELEEDESIHSGFTLDPYPYPNSNDTAVEPDLDTRTAMNEAQQVAMAKAKTEILDSHRNTDVDFTVKLDPMISLESTVYLNTFKVEAKGKVRALTETLDVATGGATCEITLAISRHGGVGIVEDTPLVPSDRPEPTEEEKEYETTHSLPFRIGGTPEASVSGGLGGFEPVDEEWDGFSTNYYHLPYIYRRQAQWDNILPSELKLRTYDEKMVVITPEIDESSVDTITLPAEKTIEVNIPEDFLVLTK